MRYSNERSFQAQFNFLRRQFLQDGELPFTDVLSCETVTQALDTIEVAWNERIYTPLVTLWVFLGQVLSADHSCRNAVAGTERLFLRNWRLLGMFSPGDILLADALMCNWRGLFSLQQRGVDTVTRLNKANRKADFRRGKRLGKDDHIVTWQKPGSIRSIDWPTYHSLPDSITVREVRVYVKQPGFRTKVLVVVTTLLDPIEYPKEDLADLYRERWNNELDLRSIKSVMQMDCLRCKTPELVRKEIWTHVLACNLIRTIMAQAASKHMMTPRSISFKGTLQTLEAFQPMIAMQGNHVSSSRWLFYELLLEAIVKHQVADRPDRIEPRRIKRRHKHYVPLSVPRAEAKRQILQGLAENQVPFVASSEATWKPLFDASAIFTSAPNRRWLTPSGFIDRSK